MQSRRIYFVTWNGDTRQVFPRNSDKLKIVSERDENFAFYRRKLSGKLVFVNNEEAGVSDYDFFSGIEFSSNNCDEIKIVIKKKCNGVYVEEWKGYFTTALGSFDIDRCTFEVEARIDDEYRCIFDNWDKKINILQLPNEIDVTMYIPTGNGFEYHLQRSGTSGGTYLPALPNLPSTWKLLHSGNDGDSNGAYFKIWYRETTTVACVGGAPQQPSGTGWTLLTDNCPTNATFVRQPLDNYPVPNPDIQSGICVGGVAAFPPPLVRKQIELHDWNNTTGVITKTNTILGSSNVWGSSTTPRQWKYKLKNRMGNSTLVWSVVGGAGLTIYSGQGTDSVEIEQAFDIFGCSYSTQTLKCEETTECGNIINHIMTVYATAPTCGALHNGYFIDGAIKLCTSQDNIILTIPPHLRYGTPTPIIGSYAWVVPSTAFDINSVTDSGYTVNLKAKGLQGNFTIQFVAYITINGVGQYVSCSLVVNVSKHPLTEPIIGLDDICKSSTGVIFKVPNRDGSNYDWTVSGGTITAGTGTNEITVDMDGVDGIFEVTVKENMTCGCTWVLIADCGTDNDTPYFWCPPVGGNGITTYRNRMLTDVIDYMIEQMPCGYTTPFCSDFFDYNPIGDAPDYSAGDNYVTLSTNKVDKLTIAAKSDIMYPNASNPATIAELSFKRLTEILREMFGVYWKLIPDGSGGFKFRFEHKKFFALQQGFDTTVPKYALETRHKNKFEHINDTIPMYEKFKWMEAINMDFIGTDIIYEALCVNKDENSNSVEHALAEVTTDIQHIVMNPTEISPDGFVIMANEDIGAGLQTIVETGLLSTNPMPNAHLSWANLHYNYLRWGRLLNTGKMNNTTENFFAVNPNVKQVQIEIPFCCDDSFEEDKGVITQLGYKYLGAAKGVVQSIEFPFNQDTIKMTLLYSYYN